MWGLSTTTQLKIFHLPLCYLVRYFASCFVELWNLICSIEGAQEPCSRGIFGPEREEVTEGWRKL